MLLSVEDCSLNFNFSFTFLSLFSAAMSGLMLLSSRTFKSTTCASGVSEKARFAYKAPLSTLVFL